MLKIKVKNFDIIKSLNGLDHINQKEILDPKYGLFVEFIFVEINEHKNIKYNLYYQPNKFLIFNRIIYFGKRIYKISIGWVSFFNIAMKCLHQIFGETRVHEVELKFMQLVYENTI